MRCILIGIAAWSLLALTACVEEEAPALVVTNAIILDDDCVAKAGEEIVRSWGRYDIFCGSAYFEPFEVWSYMVQRGDLERPRSETNIAQFERAEVQLMTPDGAIIESTFSVPVGGSVVPGDGTDPGKSVVFVDLIPAAAVSSLPSPDEVPQIVAEVQLFGTTNGDVEVETGVFRFPIDLCDGCFTYFVDQCPLWSEEDIKAFTDAEGCQHGGGFDGAYCWCNGHPTTTTSQCEHCILPAH
jgi:hypothetical protein